MTKQNLSWLLLPLIFTVQCTNMETHTADHSNFSASRKTAAEEKADEKEVVHRKPAICDPTGIAGNPQNHFGEYPPREDIKNWLGVIPDHELTPGAINPCVHAKTICAKGATTKDRRGAPPTEVILAAYNTNHPGYQTDLLDDKNLPSLKIGTRLEPRQEIDHLISLQIGGADDMLNLWPQPAQSTVAGANDKDKIEDKSKEEMCEILGDGSDEEVAAAEEYLALIQRAIAGGFIVKGEKNEPAEITWYDVYYEEALPHLDQCGKIKKGEEKQIRYSEFLQKHKEELKKIVLLSIESGTAKGGDKKEDCEAPANYPVKKVSPTDLAAMREKYKEQIAIVKKHSKTSGPAEGKDDDDDVKGEGKK